MEIVREVDRMQEISNALKQKGEIITLIPTMGALHKGHLKLMEEAKKSGDILIISIFVNPTQFGPSEDFDSYPRVFEQDKSLALELGVDYIFYPSVEEMYPEGFLSYVYVEEHSKKLCGKSRPVHFRGVTTVVAKLFNIIKPHKAFFGWKDAQQLIIIKKMAKDLNIDVEVVGVDTVRESDGLAISSRNKYLTKEERKQASSLYSSLKGAKELIASGVVDANIVRRRILDELAIMNLVKIDYVEIVDMETLNPIDEIKEDTLIALAAYVGKARLIDNVIINKENLTDN